MVVPLSLRTSPSCGSKITARSSSASFKYEFSESVIVGSSNRLPVLSKPFVRLGRVGPERVSVAAGFGSAFVAVVIVEFGFLPLQICVHPCPSVVEKSGDLTAKNAQIAER